MQVCEEWPNPGQSSANNPEVKLLPENLLEIGASWMVNPFKTELPGSTAATAYRFHPKLNCTLLSCGPYRLKCFCVPPFEEEKGLFY